MTIADSPVAGITNRIIVADIVAMIAVVDGTEAEAEGACPQLWYAQSKSY